MVQVHRLFGGSSISGCRGCQFLAIRGTFVCAARRTPGQCQSGLNKWMARSVRLSARRQRTGRRDSNATTCCVVGLRALSLLVALDVSTAKADAQSREAAVRVARDGHTAEAIRALRSIIAKDPADIGATLDLAVIPHMGREAARRHGSIRTCRSRRAPRVCTAGHDSCLSRSAAIS
jgi:hypothetical protein